MRRVQKFTNGEGRETSSSIPSYISFSFDNTNDDKIIWTWSTNGDLSFKDAYNCIKRDHIEPSSTKFIWHPYTPPSKSLLT